MKNILFVILVCIVSIPFQSKSQHIIPNTSPEALRVISRMDSIFSVSIASCLSDSVKQEIGAKRKEMGLAPYMLVYSRYYQDSLGFICSIDINVSNWFIENTRIQDLGIKEMIKDKIYAMCPDPFDIIVEDVAYNSRNRSIFFRDSNCIAIYHFRHRVDLLQSELP